jgi:hypothetical protein
MNQDSISTIGDWLQVLLGAVSVQTNSDPVRDAVLFRIDVGDGNVRELEISEEALNDLATEDIVMDLGRAQVSERLRSDSTMRLTYNQYRDVPHFETLIVRCDGKSYRVVRDSHHAVRIFDEADQLLASTPSPLPVLQMSVFRRTPSRWQEDIRHWRGVGQ